MANNVNSNPVNRTETNFIEILLREMMIGKTIYLEDGSAIYIDDLNYQPIIEQVFIKSGDESYKMHLNRNFDFDYNQVDKLIPTKHKIGRKFTR
jgi:hypothetical protein